MNGSQTLETYNAILTTTGRMLIAAKNNEWDQLITLERECKQLTDSLIQKDSEPILDKELLQEKIQIIHQILEDDAQIKAITEPWMMKLQEMLNANNRTRDLQRAYQTLHNN